MRIICFLLLLNVSTISYADSEAPKPSKTVKLNKKDKKIVNKYWNSLAKKNPNFKKDLKTGWKPKLAYFKRYSNKKSKEIILAFYFKSKKGFKNYPPESCTILVKKNKDYVFKRTQKHCFG